MGEQQYLSDGMCFVYTLNLTYVDGTVERINIFTRKNDQNIVKIKFGRSGNLLQEIIMDKEDARQMWDELVKNGWKPVLNDNGKPLAMVSFHSFFDEFETTGIRFPTYGKTATNYALIA
jgi:hypothetical protein